MVSRFVGWWQEYQRAEVRRRKAKLPPGDAPWWAYIALMSSALQAVPQRSEVPDDWFGTYILVSGSVVCVAGAILSLFYARLAWRARPGRPATRPQRWRLRLAHTRK